MEQQTVEVRIENGHGSGVFIGNGFVLTAAHVAGKVGTACSIETSDGVKKPCVTVWSDPENDAAVVYTEITPKSVAEIDPTPLKAGEAIVALGSPLWTHWVFTWGHVSSTHRLDDNPGPLSHFITVDITLAPGDSGGPIFDSRGRVRAIMNGIMTKPDDTMHMIPIPVAGIGLTAPVSAFAKGMPSNITAAFRAA
jgi:S1-C subfamily serine protease